MNHHYLHVFIQFYFPSSVRNIDKALYEMYLRTSRLDLDDYNNEVDEGLHITSMTSLDHELSIVEGFF